MSNLLRQEKRKARNALSPKQQEQAAAQVAETCLALPSFSSASHIALYLANDGEISAQPLIEHCWKQQKTVLLPVLHPFTAGYLLFVEFTPSTQMRSNRYGIAEPLITTPQICPLQSLDIIFTPLVAFDTKGNRLGMGGGFYDRTLAPVRREKHQTQLIGLAHDCQKTDKLDNQSWDVPLDLIVTPKEIIKTLY